MNEQFEQDATPDLDLVQQLPDEGIRVPVRLDQTVPVYVLPSRSGASRSYQAGATEPVLLLGEDLRRRRATIVSIEENIYVGSRDEVRAGLAALWPKLVPLVIEHTEIVFAKAAANSATVSVIPEQWAD